MRAERDVWKSKAEARGVDACNARAELDATRALATCGCGDEFTTHDPGTCGACMAQNDSGLRIALQKAEAECDAALAANKRFKKREEQNMEREFVMEQQRDEALSDARRYQWLRQRFRVFSPHIDGQHGWCATGDVGRLRGPNLDAAIDAALREGEK